MSFLRPGEHPDELISAAVSGDLSDEEHDRLDAHLAICDTCRQTLAAWTEQRRLVSQLRNAPVPRDLAPRIRSGIESGAFTVPWWRRTGLLVGVGASLATVAAALVAVAVIGNLLPGPKVASTGSAVASASLEPTASTSVAATPEPTAQPTDQLPVATKIPASWFNYRIADQRSTLQLATAAEGTQIPVQESSFPIDASPSPDGNWVAFQLQGDGSGLVSTYAFRLSDKTLISLGTRGAYSPFARFTWSPDGSLLAYTLLDESGSADVWILNTAARDPQPSQLTNTGRSFVASFISESLLWVSSAADGQPTSYELVVDPSGQTHDPGDPASIAEATYPGVFLPVSNREGPRTIPQEAVVYWRGQMAMDGTGWHFVKGGMLYWYGPDESGEVRGFDASDPQVFDTLQIQPGGAAFESARFEWAPDGDGFAVWEAMWTGTPEGEGFPDRDRVYFSHLADGLKVEAPQALDAGDTQGLRVVDVALGGGQYLGITIVTEAGSEGGAFGPTAELRLVTRNLGNVPDEVDTIGQNRVWNGPPVYPAIVSPDGQG
jgi:anti-sigma factor RsiW